MRRAREHQQGSPLMWGVPRAIPSPLIILSGIHRTRRCLPPQTKRYPKAATPHTASAHRPFSLHGCAPSRAPTLPLPSSLTRKTEASDTATASATVRPPIRRGNNTRRDDNRGHARSRCARVHTRARHHRHTLWRPCVQKRPSMRRGGRVHCLAGSRFAGFQPAILGQVALVYRADVPLEVIDAEETHPAVERRV